jgi:hypothetical protein
MSQFFSGIDLGQLTDYTALAVLERAERVEGGKPVRCYTVRQLKRWPLRTPYPDIVSDVMKAFAAAPLSGSVLVVDRTGVGVGVYDYLKKAQPAARLEPVMITGGSATGRTEDGAWSVPKRELAGALLVLLGTRRLEVVPGLPLAKVLNRELANFKAKVNIATGHESFEAWREKDHDDLVLAVAMACWYAERGYVEFGSGTPPERSIADRMRDAGVIPRDDDENEDGSVKWPPHF